MPRETAAVVGVGQTPHRTHHPDRTYVELAQDAAMAAMRDAGLRPDDIDAVVFSMAPTEFMGVNDVDRWTVGHVWGAGKPFMRINTGGATGGSAAHAACDLVCGGMYETVLVVGADRVAETPDAQQILNLIWDPFFEQDFALNTITMTALAAQRYMARHGTTEEQFARVVVRSRRNAKRNPNAHLKGDISVGDVMRSARVSWPYKRFDICPRSSGAAAAVITTARRAAEICARPAFVAGRAAISHSVFMGDRLGAWSETEFSSHDGLWMAGQSACRQAGVTDPIREIDMVELYDPFSSFQFPQLEALRFCGAGRAAAMSDGGAFDLDGGGLRVNPSGGTLCTNPIGVTGLVRFIEAASQVMGRAGDNQLPGVRRALSTAIGGSTQFFTCTIVQEDA